jgi:SAM-dependent methyltransferase
LEAEEQLGSWHSAEYAAQWAVDDVLDDMLDLPRKLSAALVADSGLEVEHVIDLGSGTGPYLELFLGTFPEARGTWIDLNGEMRELSKERLGPFGERVGYRLADLEQPERLELEPAQVVVTSRVLHHFSPDSLARLYRRLFDVVTPGGFLFNLDHIGPAGDWEQRYRRIRSQFVGKRKEALKPHRHDYPLAATELHAQLMADAGFEQPDVPWRMFYTALIAARRAGTASPR